MLIITRRAGERIMVGDDVVVEIMEIVGNSVRVGISAPRSVPVYREEIYTAVRDENRAAADSESAELPEAGRAHLLRPGCVRPGRAGYGSPLGVFERIRGSAIHG